MNESPSWHVQNIAVKTLVAIFCAIGLMLGQQRDGNFTIRLEPRAVLQAGAEIPVAIQVTDDLRRPLINATATLQIETAQHTRLKVYKATQTDSGVYVAKPVFPAPGRWSVYVEIHRGGEMSARTIDYDVPAEATP